LSVTGTGAENARGAHGKTPLGTKALFVLPHEPKRIGRIPAAELGIFSFSSTAIKKLKKPMELMGNQGLHFIKGSTFFH
jgi:hypothetical protein